MSSSPPAEDTADMKYLAKELHALIKSRVADGCKLKEKEMTLFLLHRQYMKEVITSSRKAKLGPFRKSLNFLLLLFTFCFIIFNTPVIRP